MAPELQWHLNCNGTITTYTTQRYMTGYANVQVYVTKAAYSEGNILGGPYYSMTIGVHIVMTGVNIDSYVSGANAWATMGTSGYLPNTAFTMRAAMRASVGTCHNSWAGTLYY